MGRGTVGSYTPGMDQPESWIAGHIRAIATRSDAESHRLSALLLRKPWPGGASDRSEQGALGWLRRWRPGRPSVEAIECACASGRCRVCN
jgi:hypothetical protein